MSVRWLAALLLCTVAMGPVVGVAGTYTVLHAFTGGADGDYPYTAVIMGSDGTLYGGTQGGGDLSCVTPSTSRGCGTVYKISPTGQFTTLTTFHGPNGVAVNTPLLLAGDTLYGGTEYGGVKGFGVLFSVKTDGSGFQLIHQFSGPDGGGPIGQLVRAPDGGFYGLAQRGGTKSEFQSNGVLYHVKANGYFAVLHRFSSTQGAGPQSLLIDPHTGTLFGSTSAIGTAFSTVFSYAPATGVFTTLHVFTKEEGEDPYLGSIGNDGFLYGANAEGGPAQGIYGTLFTLAPTQTGYRFVLLGIFHAPTGAFPTSGPTLAGQNDLIGTDTGAGENPTTVYGYDRAVGRKRTVFTFPPAEAGADTELLATQPIVAPGGTIYGTTAEGGSPTCMLDGFPDPNGCGVVYSLDLSGSSR
jgi:uncharacterized repeat protein (TIGR03803 family)